MCFSNLFFKKNYSILQKRKYSHGLIILCDHFLVCVCVVVSFMDVVGGHFDLFIRLLWLILVINRDFIDAYFRQYNNICPQMKKWGRRRRKWWSVGSKMANSIIVGNIWKIIIKSKKIIAIDLVKKLNSETKQILFLNKNRRNPLFNSDSVWQKFIVFFPHIKMDI